MYKVIREDDWREREREREREAEPNEERKKERKKQQTTRTRINGLSYYFHYGYNEVLMARRSDESVDCAGTGGMKDGERRMGDERPTQADGDGRTD